MSKARDQVWKNWGLVFGLLFVAVPFQGYFYAIEPTSSATHWCLANLALAPFLLFALFVLQQAVMAVTAYALGDRVAAITIGGGPKLWPRARSSRLAIRLFAVTYSHAILTARAEGQRRRTAVIHLAGMLAMLALVALPFVCERAPWNVMQAELGRRLAPDMMNVYFAALPAWYSLGALLGLAGVRGFGMSPSLLQARRIRGAAYFASLAALRGADRDALAVARRGLEDAPNDELLGVIAAGLLVTLRDPTALETLEELRQRELGATSRRTIANLWAWEAYMRNDLAHREQACELVDQLVREAPDDLSLADTHAHMLLWSAHDSAAEQHFVKVEATAPNHATRASSACGLAILHARRGDYATARRWLARARKLDDKNMMVAPAAQLLEAPGVERL